MSPRQAVIAAVVVFAAVLAGVFRIGATPILKGIGIVAERFDGTDLVALSTVFFCSAVAIIIPLVVSRSRSRSRRRPDC
jgi:hypothetical protein